MYKAIGLTSLILACTPALSDDITEAPSYAWPHILLVSREIDGSVRASRIFLDIPTAFAL